MSKMSESGFAGWMDYQDFKNRNNQSPSRKSDKFWFRQLESGNKKLRGGVEV